jgi:hypothetical protein
MKKQVDDILGERYPFQEGYYYECLRCGDVIPAKPERNLGCKCGNIFIDKDYGRISIDDKKQVRRLADA